MSYEVSVDPVDDACIDVCHLEQRGDLGISGAAIHPDHVSHPPVAAFVYGVGDFSCITPTPPLNTVPFIAGEDDPAWGPRPEVI